MLKGKPVSCKMVPYNRFWCWEDMTAGRIDGKTRTGKGKGCVVCHFYRDDINYAFVVTTQMVDPLDLCHFQIQVYDAVNEFHWCHQLVLKKRTQQMIDQELWFIDRIHGFELDANGNIFMVLISWQGFESEYDPNDVACKLPIEDVPRDILVNYQVSLLNSN
jgi:hypothetical protein